MTINSTIRKAGPYSGTGLQTAFPFAFKVFLASEVVVVQTSAAGIETTKVLGPDYTVALSLDQNGASPGGTVNMIVAPPVGALLTMTSGVTSTQGQSIPNNGGFYPKVVEDGLDRVTIVVQQLQEQAARSVKFAFSDTSTGNTFPTASARANNLLGFDSSGNMTAVMPIAGSATQVQSALAANTGATLIGTAAPGSGAVLRTQAAKNGILSFSKDMGALGDGSTDDTGNLNAMLLASSGKDVTFEVGTYLITAALVPPNNCVINIPAGVVITTATVGISMFDLTGKTGVHIFGPGKLQMTGTGTAANIGMINVTSATNCLVFGMELQGNQWSGIWMNAAINCHAQFNYIHDYLGAVQDSAGVTVYGNCVGCSVDHNKILNPGSHGVLVQGYGSNTVPLKTRVTFNDIEGCNAYGVITYQIDLNNTYTLIHGNRIRNIAGTAPNNSGGAGVYIQNSGGVVCTNNAISNVCTATLNNTLTPGGIGVNNINTTLIPPVIDGNSISEVGLTIGGVSNPNAIILAGINISSSLNGAVLGTNSVKNSVGITPTMIGLYVNASSNITNSSLNVMIPAVSGGSMGAFIFANGLSVSNFSLGTININGCDYAGFRVDTSGAFTATNVNLTGANITGTSGNCIPLRLNSVINGLISGVNTQATTQAALSINASTQLRITNSNLTTTGAIAISTSGTCTNSSIDKSVYWGTSAALMQNAATGCFVEWRSNVVPGAGNWAVGDHTIQSVPVVGSPKGWFCTVAGAAGGTQVSEGNL